MFQLLFTRNANPTVFSLSFTVTDRPPTTVACSVNGNSFTISDNNLIVVESTMDPINVDLTFTCNTDIPIATRLLRQSYNN